MRMNSPEFKALSPAKKAAHMRKLEYQREYTKRMKLRKNPDESKDESKPESLLELCTEYYNTNRRLAQITDQLRHLVAQVKS